MKASKLTAGLLALLLAAAFAGCDIGGNNNNNNSSSSTAVRVVPPFISQQPKSFTYFVGEEVQPLSIGIDAVADPATVTSYQWYTNTDLKIEGGNAIDGATEAEYAPELSTETAGAASFYYAIVTNVKADADDGYKEASTASAVARLSVVENNSAGMAEAANATFTVDAGTTYQYVRGYGGMDVAWGQFPSMSMDDFDNLFNPDKLGLNVYRIMILPYDKDDYDLSPRQMIDSTMYDLVNNITYPDAERSFQYEFVKMVNNWGGYVLASPWSPPLMWKSNEALSAYGNLKPAYYDAYGDYLNAFCEHMYEKGAPIYVVSIQNEPNYADEYDGCTWTGSQMRDFFKRVGRFTNGTIGYGGGKVQTRVKTMNGESANTPEVNDSAMNDPEAWASIDLIGRHIYGSSTLRSKALASNVPATTDSPREVWMTEHNINSGAGQYAQDSTYNYMWKLMNDIDLTIRMNDESAFIWWAMKRFYSFIGDAADTSGTTDGAILPRGYAISHYAKFSKEMWRAKVTPSGTLANGSTAIVTGNPSSNVNGSNFNVDSTYAKVTAFVSDDGNTVSLVMYTPTNTSGGEGINLGTVKIQLPEGFEAAGAVAMRSTSENQGLPVWEDVVLDSSRNAAYVTLPAGQILSVRFTK